MSYISHVKKGSLEGKRERSKGIPVTGSKRWLGFHERYTALAK
jgi:hypothetical protein